MQEKIGIIVIYEERFFQRRRVKKIVKKLLNQQEISQLHICDTKSFEEIFQKVPRISKFNLYLLSVDLDSHKDMKRLKKLRNRDTLGTFVLFVNNLDNVDKLFFHHITVLSLCEKNSSDEKRIATIEDAYNYLVKLMHSELIT